MTQNTQQQPTSHELLLAIATRKGRWLLLSILIFIGSVYLFRYHLLHYSSTATLMVVDGLKGDKNFSERNMPDYLLPTDQFNRLQQVVLSNAMFDHLIRKFRLFRHYGIDTTREFHYERAVELLRENLSVKKTPFNTITVTVTDPYRYVAYEMANEIASYADTLNRKLLKELQAKRLAMYRRIDRQLQERITAKQKELEQTLSKVERVMGEDEEAVNLRISILSLQNTVDDHGIAVKEQLFILESLEDRNFPTVMVQQKALPGASSLLFPAILYACLVVLLFALSLLMFHYLQLKYSSTIKAPSASQ